MARSLLLDVKREFVRLCQADADLLDVDITFGHPGVDQLEPDAAYPNETDEWDQDWRNIGALQRSETFELVVRFIAALPGRETVEAEDAVMVMFEKAQDIVHDQSNFIDLRNGQGRQLININLAPKELAPMVSKDGRVAGITAGLKVKGNI